MTEGLEVSVAVSQTVGVNIEVVEASATTSVEIKGTLSAGQAGSHAYTRVQNWDEEATIPPHKIGKFTMIVSRGDITANFVATTTARLRNGNHIAFIDDFQGFHNVFDFNFLAQADRSWKYRGTFQSDSSFDATVDFKTYDL